MSKNWPKCKEESQNVDLDSPRLFVDIYLISTFRRFGWVYNHENNVETHC